ncbi:hypothetical protein SJI19_17005 [Acerihabitans sp. TG2]|uniref:hypothetical protein n=1 Tax=Acerihabitans sp. TG2 TaxID=3096008 RepID=UPI002B2380E6|nr:hypothetical protein [Acerihabitans sp. TG2]MEA9392226.1 hypothetical protein [Acerihabitans sp. TG2]
MKPFAQNNLMTKIAELEQLETSTQDTYTLKSKVLIRACEKNGLISSVKNMVAILEGMIQEKRITRSTARLYKSALLNRIVHEAQQAIDKGESIESYMHNYENADKINTRIAASHSTQTSALKLKRFPDDLIPKLEKLNLTDNRFKNLTFVLLFLKANLLVGLRPVEWANTSIFSYIDKPGTVKKGTKTTPALVVSNAKATHGRGNGIERDIIFNAITVEELGDILQFSKLMQTHLNGLYGEQRRKRAEDIFTNAQQTLNRALKSIKYPITKRPTLYSTRHQCIANAKSANLTDIEIAALFGHKTTETARIHYGKKVHGSGRVVIKPSNESIQMVKEQLLKEVANDLELRNESAEFAERWLKSKF